MSYPFYCCCGHSPTTCDGPLDGDCLMPGKLFGAHSLILSNCFPKTHPWAMKASGMRFRLGEGHLFSLWGNVLQRLNRCPSPHISESRGGCLLPPSPPKACVYVQIDPSSACKLGVLKGSPKCHLYLYVPLFYITKQGSYFEGEKNQLP